MDWFKNWFDSPYYHLLYRHRNTSEAAMFIDNIIDYLEPSDNEKILDLACGKGRHSIYLNKKGFDVTGVDLSINSITEANNSSNDSLHFYQMDMRHLTFDNQFCLVMNLFTSFGYFDSYQDNISVLKGIHQALKPGKTLVIDFLNAWQVIHNLVPEEKKEVDGIRFCINRKFENNIIIKEITVNDHTNKMTFEERVSAFTLHEFKKMLIESGFTLKAHFGNYHLNPFDQESSDRLIILAEKI